MAQQTEKQSIIVAECKLPISVVELAELPIFYNLTVEEMVMGLLHNTYVTSKHFPNCRSGKTGVEITKLFLVSPFSSSNKVLPNKEVEMILDEAGFIPEELPALSVLKEYCDELWKAGTRNQITAIGENSRWTDPSGLVNVPYLNLNPDLLGFSVDLLEGDWRDYVWFVCRRKSLSLGS